MGAAEHPPDEPPVAASTKSGLWSRVGQGGWKALLAIPATLAVLAGVVTNWDTIKRAIFATAPPTEATIVAAVEPYISRQEFDIQDRPPPLASPSAAVLVPRGPARPGGGYRLAVYTPSAEAQPGAGRLLAVSSEEPANASGQTTATSAERQIKQEGEKVTEEAKHDEELAAQQKQHAAAEQKQAEARVQEEQKKEQEAQKRAKETAAHGQAQQTEQAKAEEALARQRVEVAKSTATTEQREAIRPSSQRRAEVGAPAGQVEGVLQAAHLDEGCRPTCALKPLVEKVLKASSGDVAAAARQVREVARSSTGARVHFDVTVKGLAQKEVVLTYSLVQTNGAPPPAPYLDTVTIRTFTPTQQKQAEVGSCWVPLPSSSERYYVELTVYDGETEVAYKDTSSFE
jgi:flagellar biosynthesis GTPase FlhF